MNGEYSTKEFAEEKVVFSKKNQVNFQVPNEEYNPPIVNPSRADILRGIFFFDWIELVLLALSWIVTKIIFVPLIGESMLSEPLLIFWGIMAVAFFTFRHSSSSVFLFMVQRARITEKMTQGEYVPEFKLIGFLTGLILAFFAKWISPVLIWISNL